MILSTILAVSPALAMPVPQGKGAGAWLPPVRQLIANISFDKMDANKDGSVNSEELSKGTFAWLDKNTDKFIDHSEMKRLPSEREASENEDPKEREKGKDKDKEKGKKEKGTDGKKGTASAADEKDKAKADPAAKYITAMDTNNDAKVSADEFRLPEGWFAVLDSNGDEKVSKDEYLNTKKKDKEAPEEANKEKSKKKPGANIAKLANMTPEEAMKELDGDENGSIGEDEWPFGKTFKLADQNGDGSLDKAELEGAIDYLKSMMKGKGGRSNEKEKEGGTKKGKEEDSGKDEPKPEPAPKPKPGENPPM